MSLWKIAWRSLQQRGLASTLTAISMALGVMLVVAVLVIALIADRSFQSANNLGYDLVIGKKGGRLDLLLNSVFYLSRPIENIPWEYYQEFLPAARRSDHKDGKFASLVDLAIPETLGDYVGDSGEFRVVGTTREMFTELPRYTVQTKDINDPLPPCPPQFQDGGPFDQSDFKTAVVGAAVAERMGFHVGDAFQPRHGIGPSAEKHMPFKIVGILKRTGTPNDRAAFVNIEGFFLIPDHAKDVEKQAAAEEEKKKQQEEQGGEQKQPEEQKEEDVPLDKPLPDNQREATSVLICTKKVFDAPRGFLAPNLYRDVNKEDVAQAIQPVREIEVLTDTFVAPLRRILLALSVVIVFVAGIGIMVNIYTSMSERRHEIAVMRALGARRMTVMLVVLFESMLLAAGGGLAGWLTGHLLVGAAAGKITEYTGVVAPFLQFAPYELTLIPGLIVLASIAGYLPALAAYRTDVGKALTAAQ